MDFSAQFIGYNQTGYFGRLITDYISGENSLKDFYEHPASLKVPLQKRKNLLSIESYW